jgi:MFS family permease
MTRVLSDTGGPNGATNPQEPTRRFRPGTARSALSHRPFRLLLSGTFLSSVGSWMQQLVIGPYALAISKSPQHPKGSASFVGTIAFAQLGPVLLFAVIGGVLANRYPRRRIMLISQIVQMISALGLAVMVLTHPTKLGLFLGVLAGGICNALGNPTFQAILPNLVPREDLPGVVSLNAAQINGSRVLGPLLMLALAPIGIRTNTVGGIAAAFVINAVTFLFAIVAIMGIPIGPTPPRREGDPEGFSQMLVGVRAARRNPVLGRGLLIMFFFSAFCLPFVGQFPTVSERIFAIGSRTNTYTWLYATWAMGAMLGALSIATVLSQFDKRRMIRYSLLGFAVALMAFANLSTKAILFPIALVLGFFYFATTTAMITVVQQFVSDRDRAPVMALWFMAFGGTVPLGAKAGGWVIDNWSATGLLMIGAAAAVVLAALSDFVKRSARVPLN